MKAIKPINAIKVPCPFCGQTGISIRLHELDCEGSQFHCGDCEEDFGFEKIQDFINKWTKVLAWLQTAPADLSE
jgi:transcription elongation factor Elf1